MNFLPSGRILEMQVAGHAVPLAKQEVREKFFVGGSSAGRLANAGIAPQGKL